MNAHYEYLQLGMLFLIVEKIMEYHNEEFLITVTFGLIAIVLFGLSFRELSREIKKK